VDVKTAQTVLGHSDARLTLDHYAQVVTERRAAADAMGATFIDGSPREDAGRSRRRPSDRTPPKTTERACEQALSHQSGRRDLNSRPLRPEACPGRRGRAGTDDAAGHPHIADGCDTQRSERFAGWTRGATLRVRSQRSPWEQGVCSP
jgi:hypothetical protein